MAFSDDLSTDRHAPHHSSIVNVLRATSLGALTFAQTRKDILSSRLSGCQDPCPTPAKPREDLSDARPVRSDDSGRYRVDSLHSTISRPSTGGYIRSPEDASESFK
jgi:hypothetical protein